ncbi:hypothetical protein KUTeg_000356 [Tegillarca granosa]|uniref:Very-long-chain (3R)-3-hydroxyacyl-CoA dehydratase n=1 Tax=Tegillarca granosa TaxID=220873 RepID=A0ABQ9G1Q4_TEGGR|nr:hypothetical protein KUTeg_000356 [Tegillarca granosa]
MSARVLNTSARFTFTVCKYHVTADMATTRRNKSPAQSSEEDSPVTLAYLVAYNVLQMLGWSAILLSIVSCFIQTGSITQVYKFVSPLLNVFQTAAVLEILHCACGFVRSGVMLTALQVFSRVFITWGVAYSLKSVQLGPSVLMFVGAWSITEVIRYAFYFFNLVGNVPYPIKWCRQEIDLIIVTISALKIHSFTHPSIHSFIHSFFHSFIHSFLLGELLTVINGLDEAKRTQIYSYSLPNALNVSFNFYYFLIFFMLSYIPVFPQLYTHMLAQRKKIISGDRPKTD